ATRIVYGEDVPSPETQNLRGRAVRVYDGAGLQQSDAFDFAGNLISQSRRLTIAYDATPEWSALDGLTTLADLDTAGDPLLEAEVFTTTATFDALGRPTTQTTPDASVVQMGYDDGGKLLTVSANIRGAVPPTDFVTTLEYDAKGQRQRIDYKNGASTLYSYDPPDGPRQYLVGLHISVSRGNISTYWHWATFWIPRGTDTLSKDGQPLSLTYNGACSTGDFQDQPQEVQGIWGNYVMCVNGESGGTQCGNPWGPLDECTQVSCRDCHLAGAVDFPGVTPLGELSTAWMFTLTDAAAVKACYEEIEAGRANGQTPYINLAPQECLD
ncbi:MAG: hypothetical protein KC613_03915, partial [Myxococcales bacterium]|nr:hypothetical protein [Myxococcales bacterium]